MHRFTNRFRGNAGQQSQLTGRQITRVTVSDDEWKDRLVAQGTPEGYAITEIQVTYPAR